jgi:hypothetical protein
MVGGFMAPRILTSVLYGSVLAASHSDHFTPVNRVPGTYYSYIGTVPGAVQKDSLLLPEIEYRSPPPH